jgi:cytochrome b subunit of formate dehydrogenase
MDKVKKAVSTGVLGDETFSPNFFETQGKLGTIQKLIHWITTIIQLLISVFLIAGIVLSFCHLPSYLTGIMQASEECLFPLINYVALVMIAVELIHVLNSQNLESVIEILMLALVRELVIKEWSMIELFFGVLCIGGLFAIKKWLLPKKVAAVTNSNKEN